MNRSLCLFVAAAVVCFLAACVAMDARQIDWRSDPTKPTSEAARLKCWPDVRIVSFDGDKTRALDPGGSLTYRACDILIGSGSHTVVVQYVRSITTGTKETGAITINTRTDEIPFNFTAKAGSVYQFRYAPSSGIRLYIDSVRQQ